MASTAAKTPAWRAAIGPKSTPPDTRNSGPMQASGRERKARPRPDQPWSPAQQRGARRQGRRMPAARRLRASQKLTGSPPGGGEPVEERQTACKPGSVQPVAGPVRPFLWSPHRCGLRAANPGGRAGPPLRQRLSAPRRPPLFGLAPGGVCRAAAVAGSAVGSYPTVSPLPVRPKPAGRSVLCGTFPGVAPAGR